MTETPPPPQTDRIEAQLQAAPPQPAAEPAQPAGAEVYRLPTAG